MAEFVILMREDDNAWGNMPPEEQQRLLKGYFEWVDDLKSRGIFKGGAPLGDGGRLLRVVDGEVVDGPFTETKEVATGFFMVEAASMDEARAIAATCPALFHGETVELRHVGHGPLE